MIFFFTLRLCLHMKDWLWVSLFNNSYFSVKRWRDSSEHPHIVSPEAFVPTHSRTAVMRTLVIGISLPVLVNIFLL